MVTKIILSTGKESYSSGFNASIKYGDASVGVNRSVSTSAYESHSVVVFRHRVVDERAGNSPLPFIEQSGQVTEDTYRFNLYDDDSTFFWDRKHFVDVKVTPRRLEFKTKLTIQGNE